MHVEKLAQTYELTGVPYALHRLPGQPHAAWTAQVNGQSLVALAFDFVVQQQNLQIDD